MPSSEKLEINGSLSAYPKGESFAKLLDWHLKFGTRPDGSPDQQGPAWKNLEFANECGWTDRTVRNLRTGRTHAQDLGTIERVLFGSSKAYGKWRSDLKLAYSTGKNADPSQIPPPPMHFIGRDPDVDLVLTALTSSADAGAILVQGGPGIGKTSLTRAVGNHPCVVERFGALHRWFVELDTATTDTALQDAIARAIGSDPAKGFKATVAALRERPGLLVLDNLETPWDPMNERQKTEETLASLAAIPSLAVLASLRGRDRVGGVVWALVHTVEKLEAPFDSELFRRIAQKSFEGDPHLPQLIAALDGIPLAIELVAARAYGRSSLAALWSEWTKIGTELAAHPDFEAGRLTSLSHSIELSLKSNRLTETAFRLFRLLGQLPAGIIAEDRDALLGEGGFRAEEALLRIGLAMERSGRLDLLSPIREHALRHHRPTATDQETWPAHYLHLTQRLGELIPYRDGEGALARLTPELRNTEAAFRTFLAEGRRKDVMASIKGFRRVTYVGSLPTLVLSDLAQACRADGDILNEGRCVEGIGDIELVRSNFDAAVKAFRQALRLYQKVRCVEGAADCIYSLGYISLVRSDHEEAGNAFEQALVLLRSVGSIQGEARCVEGLGDIAFALADHEAACNHYKRALKLNRRTGHIHGEANCVLSLGSIALARSNHETAGKALTRALKMFRGIGEQHGEADCIKGIGDIALARADHARAREAYEAALMLYQKEGAPVGEAACIEALERLLTK